MSGNLDDIVDIYSAETFDAELAARIFFSDHSETEVTMKLNELANLQTEIETVLRQKVRENYGLFMHANSEINRVGVEMADLKHLLDMTKKMLVEVRNLQPARSDSIHTVTSEGRISSSDLLNKSLPELTISASTATEGMPSWVRGAPHEIDRMIVEQQYQQAVTLILRSLSYLDSVKDVAAGVESKGSSKPSEAYEDFRDEINQRSVQLAETLRASLSKLPNSTLWGVTEQTKRLKLLVSLGHSDIAAQGFSTGRKDVIRKALRYVEASGDAEAYTAELSRVFFAHLRDACRSFMELFSQKISTGATTSVTTIPKLGLQQSSGGRSSKTQGEGARTDGPVDDEDMASLSYLIGWIQEQMAVFVTALSRQFFMSAWEYIAKVFEHNASFLRQYHENMLNRETEAVESPSSPMIRRSLSHNDGSGRMSGRLSTPLLRASMDEQDLSRRGSFRGNAMARKSSFGRLSNLSRTSLTVASPQGGTVRGRLASVTADMGSVLSEMDIFVGPLTFTARCLDVAFREAIVLDQLGLQGVASLGWHIVPEIKTIINAFADSIIREMEAEVAKDTWTPVKCGQPELRLPGRPQATPATTPRRKSQQPSTMSESSPSKTSALSGLFGGVIATEDEDTLDVEESTADVDIFASASYDWVVSIMTYFIGEVWALLQVDNGGGGVERSSRKNSYATNASHSGEWSDDDNTPRIRRPSFDSHGSNGRGSPSYSRVDLCEMDPEAVACLLRILVRYVRSVVATDTSNFTFEQRDCFQLTVEEICVSLLPSAEDVIARGFFSDGSTLVQNPPKVVFNTLRKNAELLKRKG